MTVDIYKPSKQDSLSLNELRLYHEITAYRAAAGLPEIPLSKGLTTTAGRHVLDTYENFWKENRAYEPGANMHSWSDAPYYSDHSAASNMWRAPERLGTGFTGNGYEISAVGYADVTAALNGWKGSAGHNNVIMNLDIWNDIEWKSIGIGVLIGDPSEEYQGKVYHVWFSDSADPTGVPDILGTDGDNSFTGTNFRDRLFGLAGADQIDGAAGNDRIEGGAGRDTLAGGAGQDGFVFVHGRGQGDHLTDFNAAEDQILLAKRAFRDLGNSLTAVEFRLGTKAQDANDHLIYDRATGRLWHDGNGQSAGHQTLLAKFEPDTKLTLADFDLI